ncbi:hypothetical protein SFA35_07450 [Pseudomonas sp. HR96]|uniref:hypothetical protein n=1 Tax=Pseudomonas sp. HR96 TaxID=1027966 RepID=UPI002A7560E2|nr:hypothetical protein [Pseudomonas sp. HR96]WPP01186.1 hypothetical protein SFA35_07450 [Pseudomonas sp. HR96]
MSDTTATLRAGDLDPSFNAAEVLAHYLDYRGQDVASVQGDSQLYVSLSHAATFVVAGLTGEGAAQAEFGQQGVVEGDYGGEEDREDFNSPGQRVVVGDDLLIVGGMTLLDGGKAYPALSAYRRNGGQLLWQKVLRPEPGRHAHLAALSFTCNEAELCPYQAQPHWASLDSSEQKRLTGENFDLQLHGEHIYVLASGVIGQRRVGALLRLNRQGEFDRGFGLGGLRIIEHPSTGLDLFGLLVRDDAITVAGGATDSNKGAFIARLDSQGLPVADFAEGGFRFSGHSGVFYRVAGRAEGLLVAAGTGGNGVAFGALAMAVDSRTGAMLYPPAVLENNFAAFWGADVDAFGRVVLVGEYFTEQWRPQMVIVRLDAAGRWDPSFGVDGKVDVGVSDSLGESIKVQENGRLLVVGYRNGGLPLVLRYHG